MTAFEFSAVNCLIIDDNPLARLALRQLASDLDFLHISGECDSARCASNCLEKEEIDLLFLDVEMPGITGLEFLKSLDRPPMTILITSKREYAVDAFECRVVDYLVKPVAPIRFMTAVRRAKEQYDSLKQPAISLSKADRDSIFIRAENQQVRVLFDELLYVSALGDYAQFFLPGRKLVVHTRMKEVEEALPSGRFQRIHRSHIVNLEKIEALGEGSSVIIHKQSLPTGEQYRAELIKQLNFL